MNDFTTKELSLILFMSSVAMLGGKIKFNDTFQSVQRKIADELERREVEEGGGDTE